MGRAMVKFLLVALCIFVSSVQNTVYAMKIIDVAINGVGVVTAGVNEVLEWRKDKKTIDALLDKLQSLELDGTPKAILVTDLNRQPGNVLEILNGMIVPHDNGISEIKQQINQLRTRLPKKIFFAASFFSSLAMDLFCLFDASWIPPTTLGLGCVLLLMNLGALYKGA
jgi:hypothetical protein